MGRGQVVGELALINDQPRSATVKCLRDCKFLAVNRLVFDTVLKKELMSSIDERQNFLTEHLPGMREVDMKCKSGTPHPSYFFKKARHPRGHTLIKQGSILDPVVFVIVRGSVEFSSGGRVQGNLANGPTGGSTSSSNNASGTGTG